jgi:hypothetical protein
MSVSPDGRSVRCDGYQCLNIASLPIALRRTLGEAGALTQEEEGIVGWLFVGLPQNQRHYCPCCLPRYLPLAINAHPDSALDTLTEKGGKLL